ncbi:MAG: hypothetical protein ACRD50_14130 [Candidatus Acidiferrales bacterium]
MSVETFYPLPLEIFGGLNTLLDPSNLLPGMSPALSDVEFFPGGVRTRPGLVSQFTPLANSPNVNGLKSYITTNLVQRQLVFDSLSNLFKEVSPGNLSLIAGNLAPLNSYLSSTTLFGREYLAFSDGGIGQDLPRQFDDTFLDRVSQVGPGEGPLAADATDAGSISAGVHKVAVVFVTRQGYWTAPSPATSWTAVGGKKVNITNIPTGPSNVVQRLLTFTAAGGANFYHVPATMILNDNTTTSLEVDFSDTVLLSGVSMDYLFALIELPNQLGVIDYAERLFWWGERTKMSNWRNPTLDGGWDVTGNGRPLGWVRDPSVGAGGSRETADVIWGDAYRITADGVTAIRGFISQNAITDAAGNTLIQKNTDYSVRARVKRSVNLNAGTIHVNCWSPSVGLIGTGLSLTAAQVTTQYVEYSADLMTPQSSLPSDLVLRVLADGVPGPAGESFLIDNIEVFPTAQALDASLVRSSKTESPESYDGVTGFMEVAPNNGQAIRAAFKLRNLLYFVKERSLHVTADDGVDEPSFWTIEEVSNKIGTPSAHGIGVGEEWVVIAGRAGLYYFDGSAPIKLSQEIQPTWDSINWAAAETIWVQADVEKKRILVGVPMGTATQPNQILVLDYSEGFGDPLISLALLPPRARKWSVWNISANACGIIERSTGVAQIFLGNNKSTGKIYAPTKGQFSDDGVAINSFYDTAFLSRTGATGRNLFGYLTMYVQGAGNFAVSAFTPGDASLVPLGTLFLGSPQGKDLELMSNTIAERLSFQFGTNAVGSWFSLTKFVPWAKPEPFAFLRGHN